MSAYNVSLSLCRIPNLHTWCRQAVSPYLTASNSYCSHLLDVSVRCSQSRITDSDFALQIAQAVGRLPGLAHVKFSLFDQRGSYDSLPRDSSSKLDRLLPVLLQSLCSSRLKRIILNFFFWNRRPNGLSTSDFLTLPAAIPSLEILDMIHHLMLQETSNSRAPEDDANRVASFLRSNKSLKSLRFSFHQMSWAQILPVLNITLEPFMLQSSTRHKQVDGIQKLELVLELGYGVSVQVEEAIKVVTAALDIAGSEFAVGEFSLSINSKIESGQLFELVMRIEHGKLVELQFLVEHCL